MSLSSTADLLFEDKDSSGTLSGSAHITEQGIRHMVTIVINSFIIFFPIDRKN